MKTYHWAKLRIVGNSYVVTVPKPIVKVLGLKKGSLIQTKFFKSDNPIKKKR